MLCSLVLAASMLGQSIDNAGKVWNGSGYALAVFDTSKPVHFNGGSLSMDLYWQPAMDGYGGGFQSLPFVVAGLQWPVTLEFYARFDPGGNTWGLLERDGHSVGDWMVEFDSASAGPAVSVAGSTNRLGTRMWAILRAGAGSWTLSQ